MLIKSENERQISQNASRHALRTANVMNVSKRIWRSNLHGLSLKMPFKKSEVHRHGTPQLFLRSPSIFHHFLICHAAHQCEFLRIRDPIHNIIIFYLYSLSMKPLTRFEWFDFAHHRPVKPSDKDCEVTGAASGI